MKRWLPLLPALLLPALAVAASLRPLGAADVPALLRPPAQGERIIALWALDCAYCESNLHALHALQRAHPHDVELVVVATDGIAQRDTIEARLHAMHMDVHATYAYAEPSPERIDYLLDPGWGGENPHVLAIHADGRRQGISGALTPAQLRKLL